MSALSSFDRPGLFSFDRLLQRPRARFGLRIVLAMVFLIGGPATAVADVCSSLRAQLRSSEASASRSPAVAQLNRQLAAIRALERKRNCSSSSPGGFFSACGSLANQRADVQRKLAYASQGGGLFSRSSGGAAIRARMASLRCGAAEPHRRQNAKSAYSGLPGGNAMLFCVRQRDGYFFPSPNSQFVTKSDDYKNTLDRCQYICDDDGMDVYTLNDISLETEEMVSVQTGKAYKDLPAAFAYRDAADFKSCDLQRYYRRVNEARARTVTPTNMANAIIPVPSMRPEAAGSGNVMPSEVTAFTTIDPRRKVRIVGDPFLPIE